MAYTRIPQGRGYAGYNDLPGTAASKVVTDYRNQATAAGAGIADQSKAGAIAFAQQQLDNYPSVAQVLMEYDTYSSYLKSIAGFNPADLQDPSKVVDLMKQALIAYAKDNGIPTNTKEFEAYVASVASSELGVPIPSSWPSNVKELKSVAVDLACTAVVMYTGVDPKAIVVTVDALMDGKLSPEECEAIGAAAGAIAGAVIGQAVGIPAPIGAFIGGLIGQDIGGTLGQIFGAGPSGTEEMNARINAAKSWAQAKLDQANAACSQSRSVYWETFDTLILATELQWEAAETQIGWRFGIRWFGIETYAARGQAFSHTWDPAKKTFTGALTSAWRATQLGPGKPMETYYSDNGVDKIARSMLYTYNCPFDFGCPYPVVSNLPMPEGSAARVGQAFLARGALWLPPGQRNYQCSYPPPNLDQLFNEAKYAWIEAMQRDLNYEQAAIRALQILSVTVVGDLVKTTAVVATEKKMNDILKASQLDLNRSAIQRAQAIGTAQRTGKNLSDLCNYGMLALGVGALGALAWKRNR
jgi:hypothetical protein